MVKGLLAKKIGMLSVWSDAGEQVAVTAVQAGPCPVLQVKTKEKDGYTAVQIGFDEIPERLANKAALGHQKIAKEKTGKVVRKAIELRDFDTDKQPGDSLTCEVFAPGEKILVTGTSKGKGFAGVVKRYNFGGGRMTHGSKFHRAPGSIGNRKIPGEVQKGKRMPGHKGAKNVTVKNVEVFRVLPEQNVVLLKGAIPGVKGATVFLYQN
ncbi:MAG TPA: 50S ribosomal protein L3 [Turneriella sp.]|nr:50S ribosomal protein L3 [Turneriella sp.]HNE19745.1 50S ribosomal protein L3 [Turneriella sp.]HNJ65448.1 50S ribosomal protein L3 [Turneriella sp.]HNL09779.1 50S ribosomal protein L3 [Turneriella sp.]HNL52829.1 50S ribosomal protein L3 [Turneriella sp.]